MQLLHPLDSLDQVVFSGDLVAPRELVDFLILLQLVEFTVLQYLGGPHDKPITNIIAST